MRRMDRFVDDKSWLEGLLKGASVLHVAVSRSDGTPSLSVCRYRYADETLCLREGLDFEDVASLEPGSVVCFQLFVDAKVIPAAGGANYTMHYSSITGWGCVASLCGRDGLPGGWDSDLDPGESKFLKITIDRMTGKSNPCPRPLPDA